MKKSFSSGKDSDCGIFIILHTDKLSNTDLIFGLAGILHINRKLKLK